MTRFGEILPLSMKFFRVNLIFGPSFKSLLDIFDNRQILIVENGHMLTLVGTYGLFKIWSKPGLFLRLFSSF